MTSTDDVHWRASEVVDARGARLRLPGPPRRIVSLVPSTTESLFALGAGDRVVGITRFCVHPASRLDGIARVGGTKQVDVGRIAALAPDLIIGNAEENSAEVFDAIGARWPLYVTFPRDVQAALQDLATLGALIGESEAAARAAMDVASAWAALTRQAFTFAWLIWRKPWMAAGPDTFISALLGEAGGVNAITEGHSRYPEIDAATLTAADPDAVLLSSEPFPFAERHLVELAEATGLRRERFHLVDGEMCSWHGVRMAAGLRYLASSAPSWTRRKPVHP